jgi:single-strand DNA-binding protein
MNLVQIAGHLGADAETRFTPNGQKVTNLRVAVNSRRNNKDETIWWRVTIWGDRFDKLLPYLKKGSAVIIVGEMSKPEIYTDKDGNPQVTLNMTAEMIKFSPFGKSEKQGEKPNGEQSYGHMSENKGMETGYGSFAQESHQPHSYAPQPSGFAGYGQQVSSG